ncbi:MAG TPA: sigma-70 family RNA polymerase sigma factor [Pyrinomonadaceae bacterium]|jgi:RNA polymerase sigma factor (TIGR02999 family)
MNGQGNTPEEVTGLLLDWSKGDLQAYEKLVPLVEKELHRIAHRYMSRERPGHTLQTTALVNEAYLRLVDQKMQWQNRSHFFGIAAELMRRILVDHARSHQYAKRGGGAQKIRLNEAMLMARERSSDLVALDDALTSLAAFDPRKARVVELRFFGGLNVEETAEVLEISTNTVKRDWTTARAWLYNAISKSEV